MAQCAKPARVLARNVQIQQLTAQPARVNTNYEAVESAVTLHALHAREHSLRIARLALMVRS